VDNKIIAVYGATASGKSALSIALAKKLNAEIISVDSAQVYRTMDIGTAKPDAETQAEVPHHLIDLIDPEQEYSVAKFIQDCKNSIKDIHRKNKVAILCGGTMLYFNRLFIGLSELPPSNPEIRDKLFQQWQESPQKTHQKLAEIDSETAQRLHPNDSQRVIRALELGLYHQPLSTLQKVNASTPILTPDLSIVLNISEREKLHQKIEQRLQKMLEQGFVDEVKSLHSNPKLHINLPSIRAVGYRQFWQYHDNQVTYDEAVEKTFFATRQLAKRQNTWIKSLSTLPNTHLFEHNDKQLFQKTIALFQ
jgi:tRNA dimethylallyltransferase